MNPLDRAARWVARVTYRPGMTLKVTGQGSAAWGPSLAFCTAREVENTYRPGQMIRVQTMDPIPPMFVEADDREEAFYDWLRRTIHRIEMHEADEFLRIDGEMRWDPHAAESAARAGAR